MCADNSNYSGDRGRSLEGQSEHGQRIKTRFSTLPKGEGDWGYGSVGEHLFEGSEIQSPAPQNTHVYKWVRRGARARGPPTAANQLHPASCPVFCPLQRMPLSIPAVRLSGRRGVSTCPAYSRSALRSSEPSHSETSLTRQGLWAGDEEGQGGLGDPGTRDSAYDLYSDRRLEHHGALG